jgi:hypothetical protein
MVGQLEAARKLSNWTPDSEMSRRYMKVKLANISFQLKRPFIEVRSLAH